MTPRTITDDERRHRLGIRHALATPVADTHAAARAMTCLHATEHASIYLSAQARCADSREQVEQALYSDRSVVRQLAMRRTVFAFPRDLLPAAWGSASARVERQIGARLAKEIETAGIAADGAAWIAETSAAVLEVLATRPATTTELRAQVPALERRLVLSPGKKYGGEFPVAPRLLGVLAAGGSVLRGDNAVNWRTGRPYWTRVQDWLGESPAHLDEPAGYAELVRRWLWSFGPGTEADMVWWLGATKSAARRALADVAAQPVLLESGEPAWLHPDDTDPVVDPGDWAALLPAMDPTTMGWQGRDFYLGAHRAAIFDSNGNAGPTMWSNGRVVGGWRQTAEGRVVLVPSESLTAQARSALAERADRLTDWLRGDVVNSLYQSPVARADASSSSK